VKAKLNFKLELVHKDYKDDIIDNENLRPGKNGEKTKKRSHAFTDDFTSHAISSTKVPTGS
jgi:hypothetical protein